MFPRVKQVRHLGEYRLELSFTDGTKGELDLEERVVGRGGVFTICVYLVLLLPARHRANGYRPRVPPQKGYCSIRLPLVPKRLAAQEITLSKRLWGCSPHSRI